MHGVRTRCFEMLFRQLLRKEEGWEVEWFHPMALILIQELSTRGIHCVLPGGVHLSALAALYSAVQGGRDSYCRSALAHGIASRIGQRYIGLSCIASSATQLLPHSPVAQGAAIQQEWRWLY